MALRLIAVAQVGVLCYGRQMHVLSCTMLHVYLVSKAYNSFLPRRNDAFTSPSLCSRPSACELAVKIRLYHSDVRP